MSTTRIIPALSKLPNISKCPPFLKSSHLILLSTADIMPTLSKLKKGKILGLLKERDNQLLYCSYRSTFKLSSSSNPHCEKE
jgi:hypothetical protein